MKSLPGVETVSVSLEKGLASVTMQPANAVTLKQIHDAVAKNGFTMKESEATISGTLSGTPQKLQLRVSGSNEIMDLVPDAGASALPENLLNHSVTIKGRIPELEKGSTSRTVKYQTIEVS